MYRVLSCWLKGAMDKKIKDESLLRVLFEKLFENVIHVWDFSHTHFHLIHFSYIFIHTVVKPRCFTKHHTRLTSLLLFFLLFYIFLTHVNPISSPLHAHTCNDKNSRYFFISLMYKAFINFFFFFHLCYTPSNILQQFFFFFCTNNFIFYLFFVFPIIFILVPK